MIGKEGKDNLNPFKIQGNEGNKPPLNFANLQANFLKENISNRNNNPNKKTPESTPKV